jgi:Fe-S cluster assembly protein SufD
MDSSLKEKQFPDVFDKEQPIWLYRRRQEAFQQYSDFSPPDRVSHLWRYTDPNKFLYIPDKNPLPFTTSSSVSIGERERHSVESGKVSAVVYNSRRGGVTFYLSPELQKSGVLINDLVSAAKNHSSLVESRLGALVGSSFGKFEALNLALWNCGIFIYVPRGVIIEKPIVIQTISPKSGNFFTRTMIIVDKGASVPIIDVYSGGTHQSGSYYTNTVIETYTASEAQFQYLIVQNMNTEARQYITNRTQLESNAKANTGIAALGGHITKGNCGTHLRGTGSESELTGVLLSDKRQHFDYYTVHSHEASNTVSTMKFKAALKDRSRSIYTGRIVIGRTAPYSEAYQENRNLLLSDACRVDSVPELEINQDEVRCSHGSATGPSDEDQLFYLKSRGISELEALQLIVEGFMGDAIVRLPKIFQSTVQHYINKRFKGGWTVG